MNVNELMSKITVMLSKDKSVVKRGKFAEAVLVDGTNVATEGELAVGAVLNVVAEDGTLSAAPAGLHETNDGKLITVGENGMIEAIDEAAPAAEEAPVEEAMEDVAVDAPVSEEALPATESLLQGIADILAPFTEEIATLTEEVVQLKAKFAEFKDEPAGTPIKRNFAAEYAAKQDTQIARLERLAQIRNSKK